MPAFVGRYASGRLATYHDTTCVAMFIDATGAGIAEAAGSGDIVDLGTLSELTAYELARTTFTAAADEDLGVLDVASDESPAADTDGDTVAGIVVAGPGATDADRTIIAVHTFAPRAGMTVDPVAFASGIATWEPRPGDVVRSVAGVPGDGNGDVPASLLAAALELTISQPAVDEETIDYDEQGRLSVIGGGGSDMEPILLVAEAGETLVLADHIDGLRPIHITVEGDASNRASIVAPDPAEHPGLKIIATPRTRAGYNVGGASFGWLYGPTPGVLGDISDAVTKADDDSTDLDFASSPATFELTVAGTPYEHTITTDHTGNPFDALSDLVAGWISDGAPITVEFPYQDLAGGRSLGSALVTSGTGATRTISVTNAGVGDRLRLSVLSGTTGVDALYLGANGTLRGTGELNVAGGQTHTWPDDGGLRQAGVISDGTDYVVFIPTTRSTDLWYTPSLDAQDAYTALAGAIPSDVDQALNSLAIAVDEVEGGSGPDLSDATPLANGTGSAGTSDEVSRADHTHPTTVLRSRRTTDLSRQSVVVPAADPGLTVAAAANTTYRFEALCILGCSSDSVDANIGVDAPAGATIDLSVSGVTVSGTGNAGASRTGYLNSTSDVVDLGVLSSVRTAPTIVGIITIGGTAGDVAIKWAQRNAYATDLTMHTGSSLLLTPIP